MPLHFDERVAYAWGLFIVDLDDILELHGMSRSMKKIAKLVQDEKLRLHMYIYQVRLADWRRQQLEWL